MESPIDAWKRSEDSGTQQSELTWPWPNLADGGSPAATATSLQVPESDFRSRTCRVLPNWQLEVGSVGSVRPVGNYKLAQLAQLELVIFSF